MTSSRYFDNQKHAANKNNPLEYHYTKKYSDEDYIYRHVYIPRRYCRYLPMNRLLRKDEWKAMGIRQSSAYEHCFIHRPEPHILCFRRPKQKLVTDKNYEQDKKYCSINFLTYHNTKRVNTAISNNIPKDSLKSYSIKSAKSRRRRDSKKYDEKGNKYGPPVSQKNNSLKTYQFHSPSCPLAVGQYSRKKTVKEIPITDETYTFPGYEFTVGYETTDSLEAIAPPRYNKMITEIKKNRCVSSPKRRRNKREK